MLDTTSYWLVVFGFCLLTVGMVSGGILARDAWKTSWLQHSKTYVSMLLWFTYGAYLYLRGIAQWRGRWTHTMIVVSVVVLLILYGSTFIVSRPSYASSPRTVANSALSDRRDGR
ncbi:MAG: cytochrome c biogenesis protein, partial [Chloroflexi bacterium]|nr:cytochrome c biogenesis protein [Chloroflexota bacterium]